MLLSTEVAITTVEVPGPSVAVMHEQVSRPILFADDAV